ncbi:hypothetical protein ACTFIU_002777 [Dictyostelium citrinum]
MVSKINKNDSDSDSGSDVENDYSGFNLIPDYKDESDTDSVYSDINNGYEIKYNDKNEYYTRNKNDNDKNDSDNNNNNNNTTEAAPTTTITTITNNNIIENDSEDEGDLKYIEDNNKNDNDTFGDFGDFTSHSEQFHTIDNENENDIESKLRSNPMFRNMDFSEYFPKVSNDPFSDDSNNKNDNSNNNNNNNNINNNNNTSIYSKSNEKGHMVLEKDKLFPPEHVQLIQDCMKNIKLDYKPHWANKVSEDKWMGVLKDKINNNNNK